jgi:hypothetical protein
VLGERFVLAEKAEAALAREAAPRRPWPRGEVAAAAAAGDGDGEEGEEEEEDAAALAARGDEEARIAARNEVLSAGPVRGRAEAAAPGAAGEEEGRILEVREDGGGCVSEVSPEEALRAAAR